MTLCGGSSKIWAGLQNGTTTELAKQTEVESLKSSVSEGKSLIASAITDKGVSTSSAATFQTMATNIGKIRTTSTYPETSYARPDTLSGFEEISIRNKSYVFIRYSTVDNTEIVLLDARHIFAYYSNGKFSSIRITSDIYENISSYSIDFNAMKLISKTTYNLYYIIQ